MDIQIILVYCLCDDMLKALMHKEDVQCQMSDAEVMTVSMVGMLYFGGNYHMSSLFLKEQGYMPRMLHKSRFSRRLHRVKPKFLTLFGMLAEVWKQSNPEGVYAIDTFPVPVCDNYRISRCRLHHGEAYRGRIASKRRFFYGLKVHLVVTQDGEPVEFFLIPGADSDVGCLDLYDFDLPEDSTIYADRIYTHHNFRQRVHRSFSFCARDK